MQPSLPPDHIRPLILPPPNLHLLVSVSSFLPSDDHPVCLSLVVTELVTTAKTPRTTTMARANEAGVPTVTMDISMATEVACPHGGIPFHIQGSCRYSGWHCRWNEETLLEQEMYW